ncbi:BofC C-terminal domain-containing protein [Metabacillus malikii]|uniref:Forespore regulator of the sigma-K checkpoint n=1 Tax=Metabacillus malikii TaxID=1504265 RepID=A0ABT9ZI57_9BACI|nr:BofC C-terminal domain-containing protein [Metabacillus malikii]MDQ0231501.1 forespore regulator of the sigma-K checkpoint [Metabacillus malikii]
MSRFHRRHILTIISIAFLIGILQLFTQMDHAAATSEKINSSHSVKVILQQTYLDGEQSEEVLMEPNESETKLLTKYKEWALISKSNEKYVFRRHIDDISPLLKTNGYFGLTGDGTLSTFNGKPETNEVIQSFFQIDIKKLESRMHHQLKKGIRIHSKDQYLEVLKNYELYSKAIKQ